MTEGNINLDPILAVCVGIFLLVVILEYRAYLRERDKHEVTQRRLSNARSSILIQNATSVDELHDRGA
jgi:hypothetical protein